MSISPSSTSGIRQYKNHPNIEVWFGPPGPQWVSDALMQRIAERAAALDTNIQTHCVESMYEMLHGTRCYGSPTMLHLRELGVLSERFSLAHGVWLTEPEIQTLVETGAALSHNPSSNCVYAPVLHRSTHCWRAAPQLPWVWTAPRSMKTRICSPRCGWPCVYTAHHKLGASCPSSRRSFTLATEGGAKLMRKEDTLGRLAPGYQADLVLVDLHDITWPWVAPEADPLELLVMRARASHVDTVMVGGEVVLQAGLPTRFDVASAAAELSARLNATPYPQAQATPGKRTHTPPGGLVCELGCPKARTLYSLQLQVLRRRRTRSPLRAQLQRANPCNATSLGYEVPRFARNLIVRNSTPIAYADAPDPDRCI